MRRLLLTLLLLSLAAAASASERGTTGADFLKLGLGAAAAGMGDAVAAREGALDALGYNPAGLAGLGNTQFSAGHLAWIGETQYEALAFGHPLLGAGTVAAAFSLLHMAEIPARDAADLELPGIRAYDLSAQFAYARDLAGWTGLPGLSGGASLKLLHRDLAGLGATGGAVDVGALYAPDDLWSFGLAAQNLGYLSSFEGARETLPALLRAGAAYTRALDSMQTLAGMADLVLAYDGGPRANLGVEYVFNHWASLRAGYKLGYDSDGFQAGAGIVWQPFTLDYALKSMGVFGLTHYLTASVNLGGSLQDAKQEKVRTFLGMAESYYGMSQYPEALIAVEQAVALDAKNSRALELREKLQTVINVLNLSPGGQPAPPPEDKNLTPDEREEKTAPATEVQP